MRVWLVSGVLLSLAAGLIINKQAKLRPKNKIVEYRINERPFGFQEGANVSVNIHCDRNIGIQDIKQIPSLELYICPRGIYEVAEPSFRVMCTKVESYAQPSPETLQWEHVVGRAQFALLFLKESHEKLTTDTCQIIAVFLNPGGKHLSSDQMMIPTIYLILSVVWLVSCLCWLVNTICYIKYSNKLHKTLSVILLLKVTLLCLSLFYWIELNKKGKVRARIDVPFTLSGCMFETLLFMFLMLAAEGWCIIWEKPRLWRYYGILAGSYFIMDLCFRYVHKYFQGFAILFASMMIYIAFRCCTISISTIKKNLTASAQFIENHRLSYKSNKTLKKRLKKQLQIFNLLHVLIIGLPCVLIIVESVASFLLEYNEWIRWLLLETLSYIVLAYCAVLFRLRNFAEYENVSIINPPYNSIVIMKTPYRSIMYIGNSEPEPDSSTSASTS